MKQTSFCSKTWLILFVMLFILGEAKAQSSPHTIGTHSPYSDGFFRPQTPDVWNMIRYGDANIDYYSGTLGLGIPVYTYKDSDFEIPVSIDYASNGYQPGSDCDVVGQGWYLNVGGAITREVHGIPDETWQSFDWKWQFYDTTLTYPDIEEDDFRSLQIFGYWTLYNDNSKSIQPDYVYYGKAGKEYMPIWRYTENRGSGVETEPDIFHYNFMGYSGSFILQPNGKIKIFNSNTPVGEMRIEFLMDDSQPLESSVVITTGDKTKYYFGQTQYATTETTNWSSSNDDEYIVHTWKLSKIEKPNGAFVEFLFAENNGWSSARSVNITLDHMTVKSGHDSPIEIWKGESAPDTQTITSNKSVVRDITGINFNGRCSISFHYSPSGVNSHTKLDSILVFSPFHNQPVKSCYCTYGYSSGMNRVMFLKKVRLSDAGEYSMEYIDEDALFPSPDTYATDWYGYYNGRPISIPASQKDNIDKVSYILNYTRVCNSIYAQMGMLKKINYPTGGYSLFTYEPNSYSRQWSSIYNSGENYTTSGLRIKQIDTFSDDSIQTQNRRFIYETEEGLSSGVLLQHPDTYLEYHVEVVGVGISRKVFSTLNNIGFSKSSHIEYLRVIEERRKNSNMPLLSKTEYNFYSASLKGGDSEAADNYSLFHDDEISDSKRWSAKITNTGSEISDWMLSSNTMIGKKLKSKIEYNADNKVVSNSEYHYGAHKQNTVSENIFSAPTLFLSRVGTHDYNTYSLYQSATISKSYNECGELIYSDKVSYSVDSLGRTAQILRSDSRGDEICDRYTYLNAVPAYPTDIVHTVNGKVFSAKRFDYVQSGNNDDHYVPSVVWTGAITGDSPSGDVMYRVDVTYSHYDAHGNPRQVTDKNGKTTCYFWGYNGRHIVAKVENSTYNILLEYGIGTTYSEALPSDVEAQLRNDEEENFIVTTYTYKPLVGVTRITDPSGHSVCYEYDDSGKLKIIRDDKGKVLKSYDYHIVTDNQ